MKSLTKFTITFFSFLFVLSVQAQEYRPPKYKWKNSKSMPEANVAREKSFNEFEENNYQVQESPYKNRDVASEDANEASEEDGRNPSSTPNPRPKNAPAYWPYQTK